jgi:uncharacterized protein YcfL
MKVMQTLWQGFLVVLLSVFLIACSKVTEQNFNQIQTGMTLEQVETILGPPTETKSMTVAGISGTSAVWRDKNTEIDIQFINDKVQLKSLNKVTS